MTPQLREKMGAAAETIGKLISYVGAGTVEFIVDENLNFYFLEVNTRLQVEHPVTEFLLGIDLVELQILVEEGYSLSELQLPQKLKPRGHAIEVRLYAEDPLNNFYPSPGKILAWKPFEMDGVRYDTGVESGI
jgi:acetyl/propionyl-CoA carboxylase alpha subunit